MSNPFTAIQPLLIEAIPRAIGSFKQFETISIVRLYYYDTHAPCTYIDFRVVTASQRRQTLDAGGRDALYDLWESAEECGEQPNVAIPSDPPMDKLDRQIAAQCAAIYERLCENEDTAMEHWRFAVQSVARQLNAMDWNSIASVTDDFVIVPADGSQFFSDEYPDLMNAIPSERLGLLNSRGYLGAGERWDVRPGFERDDQDSDEAKTARLESRIASLPKNEQLNYWLEQLDSMAAGRECDMSRLNRNAIYVVDQVEKLGSQVVVPLLKLACRWADRPEFDSDDLDTATSTPMHDVVLELLWKVAEMQFANRQVELLLRDFLERSVRLNNGRQLWGTLPFHCADCLHKLFGRYPKPDMDGNNALIRPERFQSVPLP